MNHLYTNPHLRVGFFAWRGVGKENFDDIFEKNLCKEKKLPSQAKKKKKKTRTIANSLKPAGIYIRIKQIVMI